MHYCLICVIFIAPKRISWRNNCATVMRLHQRVFFFLHQRVFMLTYILPSIFYMAIKVQLNKYLSLWSSEALLNYALNLILTESYHLFSLRNLMIRSLCLCSLNIILNSWDPNQDVTSVPSFIFQILLRGKKMTSRSSHHFSAVKTVFSFWWQRNITLHTFVSRSSVKSLNLPASPDGSETSISVHPSLAI